ncbi:MAG: UDP-N-acetylmuramoyl-tripeptide--D-alanyl-D-alanine ligase [Acidiferrobacterales bacterium]
MMTLDAAARVLHGSLAGNDTEFTGVGSDTRKLAPGDLFVALKGPFFDGHDFLADAARAGAAGAMVSSATVCSLPAVRVADTRQGLGALAAYWRSIFELPLIAVTGSNGKTTVKSMLAAIMAETGAGLATEGNLNNDIGVPLTLLRLQSGDRYAVIEMGMNHPGEIDYLTRLARPTIALITNAGQAHLAGLGSVAAVARAKGEIFAGLDESGIAIINADDQYAELWRKLAGQRRQLSFGLNSPADVSADFELDALGSSARLKTPEGDLDIRLALIGRHNVTNALAAVAASMAAGAGLPDMRNGLQKLKASPGRLEPKIGFKGARVLDDTYNANPGSLAAGMEVLGRASGERVLVIGDMAELGDAADEIHVRAGELARHAGIHRLYGIGALTRAVVQSFGSGALHFDHHHELVESLRNSMHRDMTILVKGSRVMHMERVVNGLLDANDNSQNAVPGLDPTKDGERTA